MKYKRTQSEELQQVMRSLQQGEQSTNSQDLGRKSEERIVLETESEKKT